MIRGTLGEEITQPQRNLTAKRPPPQGLIRKKEGGEMEGGGGRNKADCCRREGGRGGRGLTYLTLCAKTFSSAAAPLFLRASHFAYITKSREGN